VRFFACSRRLPGGSHPNDVPIGIGHHEVAMPPGPISWGVDDRRPAAPHFIEEGINAAANPELSLDGSPQSMRCFICSQEVKRYLTDLEDRVVRAAWSRVHVCRLEAEHAAVPLDRGVDIRDRVDGIGPTPPKYAVTGQWFDLRRLAYDNPTPG
jgi:hypothetical protein